jgi:protein tyrosine phosphatase (PTP) superfamily phosphohydrolase (DUF442 family)
MKSYIAICCFILMSFCLWLQARESQSVTLIPICDEKNPSLLPENFRVPSFPYQNNVEGPSRIGLDELSISGSAQFSEKTLQSLIHYLSFNSLLIIDLRQESHGLINGKPVSWTDAQDNCGNADKSLPEIERDEFNRLKQALEQGYLLVYQDKEWNKEPQGWTVSEAATEKESVERKGVSYLRLPIQDHYPPSDDEVDYIVELLNSLDGKTWVHVHCKMGRGRTTTIMTLFDMMHNASLLSAEEIIKRQGLIGGSDLFKIEAPGHPRHESAILRLQFLHDFYRYCLEVPDFSQSWSNWKRAKGKI